MKDYQLHFLLFGVVYSCLLLWKYRKRTISVYIFDLYLLILFHFISDGLL